MYELRKKFVKIKQVKEGSGASEDIMEELNSNYNQTRCLACNSIIKKANFLVCMDCLDLGCENFEKQVIRNETRRKK